jgi:hypothetical protein
MNATLNRPLDCTYKCHLLLNGRHGNTSEYEAHTKHFDGMYQRAAIARLHPGKGPLYLATIPTSALNSSAAFVVIKRAEVDGLRSDSIVLARDDESQGLIQHVFFHRYGSQKSHHGANVLRRQMAKAVVYRFSHRTRGRAVAFRMAGRKISDNFFIAITRCWPAWWKWAPALSA